MEQSHAPNRILRQSTVLQMVGVHATTIYRWEQQGRFPKRLQLGPGSVGWREADIEGWLADRPVVDRSRSVAHQAEA